MTTEPPDAFPASRWRAKLGLIRDAVRQELVARQVDQHLPRPPATILDVGCGQGTQTIRLARRGYDLIGLDSSAEMLATFAAAIADEPAVRPRVRLVQGPAERLGDYVTDMSVDAVLCHGVLMYVAEPRPLVDAMARAVKPGGVLSILARNGDALAMRPGLQGRWSEAIEAADSTTYPNRIGIEARADTLDGLRATLIECGLDVRVWYGVRVFTDHLGDVPPPDDPTALFAAEELAGQRDPYRRVAALLHVLAVRRVAGGA